MNFATALDAGFAAGNRLCVGIDPHSYLLADWGLDDSASSAEIFGRTIVAAAAAGEALVLKPQIAFFERFGSAGYVALERVLSDARAAGIPVIADVKRGDIGSSFTAYAEAWLTPGNPLEVDAMTVAAYQGFGSLAGGLELAEKHGKGLFVLAATSNPEARETQRAQRNDGMTVAQAIVAACDEHNLSNPAAVGSVGVVLGATLKLGEFGLDIAADRSEKPVLPILAPGFGAQGAKLTDAAKLFGTYAAGLIPNESRGVLVGGKSGLQERIATRAAAIKEALV